MVGGTGFEPVTPTVSWKFWQVHRAEFESTVVSGSLMSSPPIERLLRDLRLAVIHVTEELRDPNLKVSLLPRPSMSSRSVQWRESKHLTYDVMVTVVLGVAELVTSHAD